MDNNVFRSLSYGVYVVATYDIAMNRPTGCVANSAMQVTSAPPTVAVSINLANYTNECIKKKGKFSLSILGENIDKNVIPTFGFSCGRSTDKFDAVPCDYDGDVPFVADAVGYIVCKVIDTMEYATHTVFLGEVIGAETLKGGEPMTYAYYHKVVKGKTAKNAPTYIEDDKQTKGYKCDICGYVYEGDSVPQDFVCPVCGADKSHFTK